MAESVKYADTPESSERGQTFSIPSFPTRQSELNRGFRELLYTCLKGRQDYRIIKMGNVWYLREAKQSDTELGLCEITNQAQNEERTLCRSKRKYLLFKIQFIQKLVLFYLECYIVCI